MAVPDFAAFTTDDARMILRVCRQVQASGLLENGRRRGIGPILDTIEPYHVVRNTSGEAIPPFGCMQMVDTSEIGGRNYLDVDQPADSDGTAGGFLFSGPNEIEIGGNGIGFAGPVVRALSDGTAVSAGQLWSPQASSWQIAPNASGLFRAAGPDDIASDVIRVQVVGGGGGGGALLLGFELTSGWTAGQADADFLNLDLTTTGTDGTVRDPLNIFEGTDTGDRGLCLLQDGNYYAIQMPCPEEEE